MPGGDTGTALGLTHGAASLAGIVAPSLAGWLYHHYGYGVVGFSCAGVLLAMIFPTSPVSSTAYLGKAFVVCVLGGLGSVPGAVLGGLLLGLVESFGAWAIGPEHAVTLSFALLIAFLIARPQGLLGRQGFE